MLSNVSYIMSSKVKRRRDESRVAIRMNYLHFLKREVEFRYLPNTQREELGVLNIRFLMRTALHSQEKSD